MSDIADLWAAGRLPIKDGLYFADGRSYAVEVVDAKLRSMGEFDLSEWLARNPDWLATIDISQEIRIPDGYACVGYGAWGSEGFFACLNDKRSLIWVCYLSESNPFNAIEIDGSTLTAWSTRGISIALPLGSPEKAL